MFEHRRIRSLGIEAAGKPFFFDYDEPPPGPGQLRLDTLYTGFSAGTELTFLKGSNPYLHASWDSERGLFSGHEPAQRFPVPFLGYMEVARVGESHAPEFATGDIVAATYAHKTGHTADPFLEPLVALPPDLDPILGIYVAQMGPIAANGILHADAELSPFPPASLGAALAGRPALVIGGGVVGMLTALFATRAGAEVVIADPSPFRRSIAGSLGLVAMTEEVACQHAKSRWRHGQADRGADIVFQTRAHAASLQAALTALRPQGSVIDLAFYQRGADALRLGEAFHHNGLSIRCAQIGRVPRGFGRSWDRARLARETIALLSDTGPAIRRHMITHVIAMDDAPRFLATLVRDRPDFLQIVFQVTQ